MKDDTWELQIAAPTALEGDLMQQTRMNLESIEFIMQMDSDIYTKAIAAYNISQWFPVRTLDHGDSFITFYYKSQRHESIRFYLDQFEWLVIFCIDGQMYLEKMDKEKGLKLAQTLQSKKLANWKR